MAEVDDLRAENEKLKGELADAVERAKLFLAQLHTRCPVCQPNGTPQLLEIEEQCSRLAAALKMMATAAVAVLAEHVRPKMTRQEARRVFEDALADNPVPKVCAVFSAPHDVGLSTRALQKWLDSGETPADAPPVIEVVREVLRLRMILRDAQEGLSTEMRSWGEAPYSD